MSEHTPTIWEQKQWWLEAVMADVTLSYGAKLLAWDIHSRAFGDKLTSKPGRNTIAKDLGLRSTGRVDQWRYELVDAGAVATEIVETPGGKKHTEYTILLGYEPSTMVPNRTDRPSTIVPDTEHHGAHTEHDGAQYRAPSCSEYTNSQQEKTPKESTRGRQAPSGKQTLVEKFGAEQINSLDLQRIFDKDRESPGDITYQEWLGSQYAVAAVERSLAGNVVPFRRAI